MYGISDSLILLLVVPPFVAGLGMVFRLETTWATLLMGVGLMGVGIAGWVDLVDNCVVDGCDEDDPLLLTAGWALSAASLVTGSLSASMRAATRRRTSR